MSTSRARYPRRVARRAIAGALALWASSPASSHAQTRLVQQPDEALALAALAPAAPCATAGDRVACLLEARFSAHPVERSLALALRRDLGVVLGVSRTFDMNGGYRGMVHFVPELPVGRYAVHARRVDGALREIDAFVRRLEAAAGARAVAYRATGLVVRFTRSTNTTTPNAFVQDWEVHYNVNGSILRDDARALETLVHELFHANDAAHHDWSARALAATHRAIASRCGVTRASTPCLTPYAPNTLRVRNGTYYAFHGGNDVREYAAELAVRYFREHTGRWSGAPFKCGPVENARAWRALVDEFFGGVDETPACSR